jgi:hypothetical protein
MVGELLDKVTRAVARLEVIGLLTFKRSRISFAGEPDELTVDSTAPSLKGKFR